MGPPMPSRSPVPKSPRVLKVDGRLRVRPKIAATRAFPASSTAERTPPRAAGNKTLLIAATLAVCAPLAGRILAP
jgi:hypothetical protein